MGIKMISKLLKSPVLLMVLVCIFQLSPRNLCQTSSSSYLNHDENYNPNNLFDKNLNTAWVVSNTNQGINEYAIEKFYNEKIVISDIGIYNGYQKSPELFIANNRVKTIGITLSDGTYKRVTLSDKMGVQWITLGKETEFVQFKILSIYKGNKYNDTCLTEIIFSDRTHFYKINRVLSDYYKGKSGIDQLYDLASRDNIEGKMFFDYLTVDNNKNSAKAIFNLYEHNEENQKSFNVFVSENCIESIGEKILNYPENLTSYINESHLNKLKLLLKAYKSLKNNYLEDIKGMVLIKEHFKKAYSTGTPEIKKLLKNIVSEQM